MISQIDIKKLTQILPIFPLPGAIVLPNGNLPLNIFEPRYISMIESVLGSHRMIGMVQPHKKDSLYPVGCAAKIISFSETSDNRYFKRRRIANTVWGATAVYKRSNFFN